MIILCLVISIALTILGGVIMVKSIDYEAFGLGMAILCGFATGILIVVTALMAIEVSNLTTIDERLAMYEEENAKIESQIVEAVENYQKYETDIFTELSPESAMTLVSLYPDLKSDTLVQKQIEVYIANNDKIKELNVEKINGSVKRWWLYFGG